MPRADRYTRPSISGLRGFCHRPPEHSLRRNGEHGNRREPTADRPPLPGPDTVSIAYGGGRGLSMLPRTAIRRREWDRPARFPAPAPGRCRPTRLAQLRRFCRPADRRECAAGSRAALRPDRESAPDGTRVQTGAVIASAGSSTECRRRRRAPARGLPHGRLDLARRPGPHDAQAIAASSGFDSGGEFLLGRASWQPPMNRPAPPAEGQILTGPLFNEPMRVETVAETGPGGWTLGLVGTRSERFRRVSLGAAELAALTVLDSGFRYDGDGALLRLGLQAHALGIAWEFDPYFGLSVSRVDPLPHQLEAVYDHLLKLARAVPCWPTTPGRGRRPWPRCSSASRSRSRPDDSRSGPYRHANARRGATHRPTGAGPARAGPRSGLPAPVERPLRAVPPRLPAKRLLDAMLLAA